MKIASFVLLEIIICLGVLLSYVKTALPNLSAPEIVNIEPSRARLERRTYRANHAGVKLAGGVEFPLRSDRVVPSSNSTPDKETGIGKWTEEAFVKRIRTYADLAYVSHHAAKRTFTTYMSWPIYGNTDKNDLKAIFPLFKNSEVV